MPDADATIPGLGPDRAVTPGEAAAEEADLSEAERAALAEEASREEDA